MTARIVSVLALLVLLQQGGCFGHQARKNALAPAIDAQATDVVAYARRYQQNDVELVAAFEDARVRRDWAGALAAWPVVQQDALAGIDAGPESEGVKGSLREQVNRLDSALRKAVARGR